MKILISGLLLLAILYSCNDVKEKAKESINKSGEAVGETATEFIEGVTEGVDRTLDCKIIISDNLVKKGLKAGKFHIEKDSTGKNNKLVIYLITERQFENNITFKVLDKKGLESGRKNLLLNSAAANAAYYDIDFDKRTEIEVKSTIEIQ